MENRILINGRALDFHPFWNVEKEAERAVAIVESDLVIAVDFGQIRRV